MLKVHNWWTLAGAVLLVIILYNFLVKGDVTVKLTKILTGFVKDETKQLEVPTS